MSRHDISGILVKYAQARIKRAQEVPSAASLFPSEGPLAEGTEQSTTPGSWGLSALGSGAGFAGGRMLETMLERAMANYQFKRPLLSREQGRTVFSPISNDLTEVGPRVRSVAGIDLTNENLAELRLKDRQGRGLGSAVPRMPTTGVVSGAANSTDVSDTINEVLGDARNRPDISYLEVVNKSTPGGKDPKTIRTNSLFDLDAPAGGSVPGRLNPFGRRFWHPFFGTPNSLAPSSLGRGQQLIRAISRAAPLVGAGWGAYGANKATEGTGPVQLIKNF